MTTGFASSHIAHLYDQVPPAMVDQLREFRTRYPYKQANINGVEWRYIDTGEGDQVILLLAGAACIAEISWSTIQRLARHYRVIAPDNPAVDTNVAFGEGIVGLLQQENIRRVHVVGGSAGGLAAQFFVRRYPDLVSSLTLSHTFLLTQASEQRIAKTLRWLRLMPQSVLRFVFKRTMRRLMPEKGVPEGELLRAHFAEIVDYHLTKAQIISLMQRTVDLKAHGAFSPDDLKDWSGRILLILSEDDPATPEPMRQAMTAMYPQAQMRLFSGTGHSTSAIKPEAFVGAIEEFIQPHPEAVR